MLYIIGFIAVIAWACLAFVPNLNRGFRVGGSLVMLVAFLLTGSCSFTKVDSGHVGVKVNNLGSGAGVDPSPLGMGWYFTPPGVTIYEYPVFTTNYAWKYGDGSNNERFSFQDKNGLSISADVSIAFRIDPAKAPTMFQKYRVDTDQLISGAIRNAVRNAIVTEASGMSVEQIYGAQKAALIERARVRAAKYLEPFGIHIEQLFWASDIILPGTIQSQINQRVANEQAALAAQANVATREAEGRSLVATANAKAQALKIEQEAIAGSPDIVHLRAVEKWDGHLPQYVTSGAPMPFIGGATSK